ncbi:MAG TPA: hypothetical protein VFZ23_00955 [Pyrinomonadaceae bacterium]
MPNEVEEDGSWIIIWTVALTASLKKTGNSVMSKPLVDEQERVVLSEQRTAGVSESFAQM